MGVDAGIFGPSSVTWHLHADPAMWIGGISALHLQALHPVTALGIAQNSSFGGTLLVLVPVTDHLTYGRR